ncbi:Bardet-Biedl syndrome 2 protein-like isoform X2 [Ischnura elegans]|uniref:Bardet-Biedl syndrome 2 protein-like isoform X2 n=1 Tax=Ischnura elegans TaxID=197161 RepID=UPI001ED881B1|nr:Bardet-Biedl syndrome 2 protein-like isoform X2 [Ischnura elegans]
MVSCGEKHCKSNRHYLRIRMEVLIYQPKSKNQKERKYFSSKDNDIITMNINQVVTSICAGCLNENGENDVLLIGTDSHLHAYDVHKNVDLFYQKVKDGVNSISIGNFGRRKYPVALVGGNCCVRGFDASGSEVYWNVVGDSVCSMALVDFDKDGENELVVGSADYEITAFKNEMIVSEITETEVVTQLVPLDGVTFAYALSNGTIGMYDQLQRWWRVKSKNQAVSIIGFDIDGDGVEELITGWSNGKIDARNSRSGDIVFTEHMNDGVAGIAKADLMLSGKDDLVCCSENGDVMGFQVGQPTSFLQKWQPGIEEETVQDMMLKRKDLLQELKNYEGNAKYTDRSSGSADRSVRGARAEEYGVIPAHTRLQTRVSISMGNSQIKPHVELGLSTNNDTIIRLVLVYGEGIFDGETHVIHPKESQLFNKVKVPLFPPRDVPLDFHLKALVGYPGSVQFHVFELTRQIPRFSMYKVISSHHTNVVSYVSFNLRERVQRILMWMNQNFILPSDIQFQEEGLNCTFSSLRTNEEMSMTMDSGGNFVIKTNDMGLAGDLIQSLAVFLNLEDLQVVAHFPLELEKLKKLMEQMPSMKEAESHLVRDMANSSAYIRKSIVQTEDSYLLNDLDSLKEHCFNLSKITETLIHNHKIYCDTHEESQTILKDINLIVQKASRLRVGASKANLIQLCHTAVEKNNFSSLAKIFTTGVA